jgi:endogenous inhibitor of DNA gyrase (YacG/DUF329 family)/predicted phosphodiesterase
MTKELQFLECPVCGIQIGYDRVPPYCSKKCEASVEGYSDGWTKVRNKISASTAWAGIDLDPIVEINSGYPITVLSDIHAPLHSGPWMTRAIEHAIKLESKIAIINGDFIDANQISKHLGTYFRRKQMLGDDFEAGAALMEIFSQVFENVYFLAGNHCIQRLNKLFGGEVAANRFWKIFGSHENIKVTERSFLVANKNTLIGHPRSYSRSRSVLPQKIAMVKQKHVVLGHGHHGGMGYSQDGKWIGWDIPCLANLELQDYTTFEINDMPQPINGYGVLEGDCFDIFHKHSNWKRLGFKGAPEC